MKDFDLHSKQMEYAYNKIKETLDKDSLGYLLDTRAYFHKEQHNLLAEMGILQASGKLVLNEKEKQLFTDLGMYSDNGYFLLEDRYVIPVYSASGELITLIGWYNDFKKYITVPSPYFDKSIDWFNLDNALELSFSAYDGLVFVLEGIFDTLSLRAIGLPAVSTMGVDVSRSKGELLKVFKKVVAIPDNDKSGRKAIRDKHRAWSLPYNSTFLELRGMVRFDENHEYKVKDVDNLVSWFEVQSVRDMLLEVGKSTDKYEILHL